jgi:hypothetical protein
MKSTTVMNGTATAKYHLMEGPPVNALTFMPNIPYSRLVGGRKENGNKASWHQAYRDANKRKENESDPA